MTKKVAATTTKVTKTVTKTTKTVTKQHTETRATITKPGIHRSIQVFTCLQCTQVFKHRSTRALHYKRDHPTFTNSEKGGRPVKRVTFDKVYFKRNGNSDQKVAFDICNDSAIRDPTTSKTLVQRFGDRFNKIQHQIDQLQGGCDEDLDNLVNFTTQKEIDAVKRIQNENVHFAIHDLQRRLEQLEMDRDNERDVVRKLNFSDATMSPHSLENSAKATLGNDELVIGEITGPRVLRSSSGKKDMVRLFQKVEEPQSPNEFQANVPGYVQKQATMTVTEFKKHSNIAYKTSTARMNVLLQTISKTKF